MRLLATPGTGALEWVRDFAVETVVGSLGDLALTVVLVPSGTKTALVDELFRGDVRLGCVVVQGPDGPVLVERSWFEAALAGRLGYGRLLYARRPILELVTEETLVLPHDCTVEEAAAEVIARRVPGQGANAVVVAWPSGRLGVAHVSTIFERLARQYAYQSSRDQLTELPNRSYLMEQIQAGREARRADGADWQGVLFDLDLDGFKTINDRFGYDAGDQVLAQFAQRLRGTCRLEDLVVRLGGDEFAVLRPARLTRVQSEEVAAMLVLLADPAFVVEVPDAFGVLVEQEVTIGVSVGVAHSDGVEPAGLVTSSDVLLRRADTAMCRAKEHGGRRAVHFDPAARTGLHATDATRARRTVA